MIVLETDAAPERRGKLDYLVSSILDCLLKDPNFRMSDFSQEFASWKQVMVQCQSAYTLCSKVHESLHIVTQLDTQSLGHSLSQSVSHSVRQSVTHSLSQSLNYSVSQAVSWSVSQSPCQSVSQTLSQSVSQLVSQSVN